MILEALEDGQVDAYNDGRHLNVIDNDVTIREIYLTAMKRKFDR